MADTPERMRSTDGRETSTGKSEKYWEMLSTCRQRREENKFQIAKIFIAIIGFNRIPLS